MVKKDKIPNTIFNTILDDIKQGKLNSGDALPVSYTHLDVYKRQYPSSLNLL